MANNRARTKDYDHLIKLLLIGDSGVHNLHCSLYALLSLPSLPALPFCQSEKGRKPLQMTNGCNPGGRGFPLALHAALVVPWGRISVLLAETPFCCRAWAPGGGAF